MTQNLGNCFPMTQSKLTGLFISPNFVPKFFWGRNLVPKLESALFKMELNAAGCSKALSLNAAVIFLNFVPKIRFLEK